MKSQFDVYWGILILPYVAKQSPSKALIKNKVEKGRNWEPTRNSNTIAIFHYQILDENQLGTSAIWLPQSSHHIMQSKQGDF